LGECLPDGWRQELDDEVRSYAALLADEKIQAGMTNEQARRNARIELGGIEQTKEQVREVRAGHLLESFWRDQRIALRALRKKPGFTIVVVLSLALAGCGKIVLSQQFLGRFESCGSFRASEA
jgi:hypothetical protein